MNNVTMTDDELMAIIGDPSQQTETGTAPNRINFGALKEKPKATGNSQYPELPDPTGEVSDLADEFLKQHEAENTANGAKEIARGQIIERAVPFHWKTNCGRTEISGTVSVRAKSGSEVLVQFKDAYKPIADTKDKAGNIITPAEKRIAIPRDVFDKYFRQTFSIAIDSTRIAENKLQEVVNRIQALAAELEIGDAVGVTSAFKPIESWHADRYRILTSDQNMAAERAMGERGLMTIAVTTARGRKK